MDCDLASTNEGVYKYFRQKGKMVIFINYLNKNINIIIIKSIQEWFGIEEGAISRLRGTQQQIQVQDITIDDDHPPPEWLDYGTMESAKELFTTEAWNTVQDACE